MKGEWLKEKLMEEISNKEEIFKIVNNIWE